MARLGLNRKSRELSRNIFRLSRNALIEDRKGLNVARKASIETGEGLNVVRKTPIEARKGLQFARGGVMVAIATKSLARKASSLVHVVLHFIARVPDECIASFKASPAGLIIDYLQQRLQDAILN